MKLAIWIWMFGNWVGALRTLSANQARGQLRLEGQACQTEHHDKHKKTDKCHVAFVHYPVAMRPADARW
jgi:hypothetical protein